MSERAAYPNATEVALGALLHDIGKFMQRALGDVDKLSETVKNRIGDVLPVFDGRYSHFHALFSDAFFEECVDRNPLPQGLDARWIRDCAVYHHKPLNDGIAVPNGSITHLVTWADRIAAAMERKKQDEDQERSTDPSRRDKYRRTKLTSTATMVHMPGRTKATLKYFPVTPLAPDALFDLEPNQQGADVIGQYIAAWDEFRTAYGDLAREAADSRDGFVEGLLALSERFCWSIPSSTIDEPDVSLHDHGRVAAAVAACLQLHHVAAGDLHDTAAIQNRSRPKFRLVVGDLSGIQSTLFRLNSEGVSGLARLLRGRSFRMQMIGEAAARLVCRDFGLTPLNILQLAGGRFLVLVPETSSLEAEGRLHDLRVKLDEWMTEQYLGDLVVNIQLTPPLSASDLIDNIGEVYSHIAQAADEGKQRPLSTSKTGVIDLSFNSDLGICSACGVRPAAALGNLDRKARCKACHAEVNIGQRLAKADAISIGSSAGSPTDTIFGIEHRMLNARDGDSAITGYRLRGTPLARGRPVADRFFEAYVPRHDEVSLSDPKLQKARQDTDDGAEPEEGSLLTFAEIAARSVSDVNGKTVGRPMLAMLRADVDNLGKVFSIGLGTRRSLARTAAMSRLIDAFFTGWLPSALRRDFPNIYTVYAGGDDLMILGPWLDVLRFAPVLRQQFGRFSGDNESLTLSAGIALFDTSTPISTAAAEAARRLEAAKSAPDGAKDRVCAIGPEGEPIAWSVWSKVLETADELHALIGKGKVSTSLLYRLIEIDGMRSKARTNPAFADWRAKLGYTLFRSLPKGGGMDGNQTIRDRLLALMGVDQSLASIGDQPLSRIAITIALYRNR